MFARKLLFILTLLVFINNVISINILAIVSLPLGSHYMAFRTLFRELAVRGHNITVMNNFPDKDEVPNLKFVNLEYKHVSNQPPMDYYETVDPSYAHIINYYHHITFGFKGVRENCEVLFTSSNANEHYASGAKYDVIFVEQFISDCDLAYAGVMYDAPIIGITSHVLLPWSYPRLGLPFDVAADSFYFSKAGPNPSLLQKAEVYIENLIFNTVGKWLIHKPIYEVFDKFVPNNRLNIDRVAKERMKMVFSYQHFSVTGARPLAPQLLEIAGIHVGVPKPVDQEMEQFLSDAHHGAIYFSFGSNLKPHTMSKRKLQEFLDAFTALPYKVIWKTENATLPDVYKDKIYVGKWFSQLDILCHPKVLAFVSHGGMLSLSESTHCGKPLVMIPFFGDQFSNAAMARSVGLGKILYFSELNADNLKSTILELTSQEMQQNARRISKLWHDRPQSVMDSAIYWTEYVARHGTAPPSLPVKHNTCRLSKDLIMKHLYYLLFLAVAVTAYDCKGHTQEGHTQESHTHEGHTHEGHTHEGHTHEDNTHEGDTHKGHTHEDDTHVGDTHKGHTHEGHTHEGHTHEDNTHEGDTHKGHTHEGHTHEDNTHVGDTHKVHTREDNTHEGHTHADHTHDNIVQEVNEHNPHPRHASVVLAGENVRGVIAITVISDSKILFEGEITGMTPGEYGLTIYEYGDISNGCNSTGAHFNPDNNDHGHPCDKNRHAGDLDNVEFNVNNTANVHIYDHILALHGKYNILGRALVLHSQRDDHGHSDHPHSKITVALSRAYASKIGPFAVRPSKILIMKHLYCLLFLGVAVSVQAHHRAGHNQNEAQARVLLTGNNVRGNITFTELPDKKIHVEGVIVGMPPGMYGFHVHESGDITQGCGSTGAHFNPDHKDHGHPEDENRHVGDLGNIEFDKDQTAHIDLTDRMIAFSGTRNIIGRAVVLHDGPDDYGRTDHPLSKKTGNAGGRAACGVIGLV
ncbi:hypothetical protein K1T71_003751 [Dendrolimus kikuchii]|uniref:Uncharacterized protein n=1 Tax=Dendrolimus kikuchii TaxID=765133 RepID=A0ACC1D926_9NEOP|nr:hypothetical protein K1T71_003751 [Dendrolimus kikuchii]